jgi:molybdopterin-dependent oxidoreductase alpha subunit
LSTVDPVDEQGADIARVGPRKRSAAGVPAVAHSLQYALEEMGVSRTGRVLRRINHTDGFDCPSCAWPDPEHRSLAEFCENGAKAVSWEATRKSIGADFFAEHSIADLRTRDGHWLEANGRLSEPLHLAAGDTHYRPISWDAALRLVADQLRALPDPNRAFFYTSGRASNEAAFMYQLLARKLGTNNLPDCSNMCHESSGLALTQTIGVGKGTVTLKDIADHAELIVIVGQNPGTNHPRMLTHLERAKRRGARIVAINPLPEAGLTRFRNPQNVRGLIGNGTKIADSHLPVKIAGDLALFSAVNRLLVEREDAAPGSVLDSAFIERYTDGFDAASAAWRHLDWTDLLTRSGLTRHQLEEFVDEVLAAKSVIVCWAMGLTQHRDAVATIREIVNFLLLRGNIGRPGAGACPVRGHSNVQGDRTMGIWEKMPDAFLDKLGAEFAFEPPREHGRDSVDAIRAMRDREVDVFMALGGNFVAATPDTAVTEAAMTNCALTVHISTKLNRSHLCHGREALILPCLGRTERDRTGAGEQAVTVEDSMSMVHRSIGRLAPASPLQRSEVDIVTTLGHYLFGTDDPVRWLELGEDYRLIRKHIERVVVGFDSFEQRLDQPGGFVLPNGPRDSRTFATHTDKANFTVNVSTPLEVPPGHLLLQTIRSHDQFNTSVYGLDDRYRGIKGGRHVVFVSAVDLAALGIEDGELVDLISVAPDGERRANAFRTVRYDTPVGCAAAYFPEANVLVALDSTADGSNTPASKSIVIRIEPAKP